MTEPITTIFFDWDYTLAYTRTPENTLEERLTYMFQLADMPFSRAQVRAALEQYRADIAQGRVKTIENPQTRRDVAQQYIYLLRYLGYDDVDWPLLIKLYGTYANLPHYLFEDTIPTLEALRAQGYTLGILSNHAHTARPVMEALVGDLVPSENIVISEEEGVHKPAKTIFRRATQRVSTPPEQCVFVGDNLRVDAVAAVENGRFQRGIWLDRQEKGLPEADLPDSVGRITTLLALPEKL